MTLEIWGDEDGTAIRLKAEGPAETIDFGWRKYFWREEIRFHAKHYIPFARVELDALALSDSPRGPVYSETAMEWEKGK